jgi:hypothetical protein
MRAAAVLLLPSLAGCPFFGTGPTEPDAAADGVLSCAEAMDVAGLGGTTVPVEAPPGSTIRIATHFDDPSAVGILVRSGEQEFDNLSEYWDPREETTALSAFLAAGQAAEVRLVDPDSGTLSGELAMRCDSPGEQCWNLSDDDGDGAIDCADDGCAREPDCVAEQADLQVQAVACGVEPIDPPTLRAIDDQRTLYTTSPLGDEYPAESFWGGAELALIPAGEGVLELTVGTAGIACAGTDGGTTIFCDDLWPLVPGEPLRIESPPAKIWIEPLGASFASIEAGLDCGSRR